MQPASSLVAEDIVVGKLMWVYVMELPRNILKSMLKGRETDT